MPEGVRKGAFYTLLGLGVSAVFLFLFNVLAARALGPSGFGIYNVLYSIVGVITPLLAGGIRIGTTKFISTFEARNEIGKIQGTIRSSLTLLGFFLLLFLIIVLILKNHIQNKYLNHSLFLFLILILVVFFRSFVTLIRGILQGLRELKYNAITVSIEYFSMLLLLLVLVLLFELGVNGACASLFGALAITLVAVLLIYYRFKNRLTNDNHDKGKPNLREFFHFVGPVALANFLSFFLFRSGPFLIKTFGGLGADKLAGLFASAFALIGVARMLVTALSGALFPNLSRAEALGNVDLQSRYIKKSIIFVAGISLLMIIFLGFFGTSIVKILYGKEFVLRRLDLALIASMGAFYLFAGLLNNILLAKSLPMETLICWASGTVALILFVWLAKLDTLLRVEAGLCLASFTTAVLMLALLKIKGLSYSK